MAYPDLQTMFNNGMGSMAAIQIGNQQAEEQQKAAAAAQMQQQLLQEQQLKNQQTQAMNPLDQMFRRGQVDQQAATLPGIQAQSRSAQSQAAVDEATQASKIAASISESADKLGTNGMKSIQRGATIARQSAALLRTIPVPARQAALTDMLGQYGNDPNTSFMKAFIELPPDKMPDMIDQVGQGMAMASDNYITEISKQKMVNESHERASKYSSDNSLAGVKYSADARERMAQTAAAARQAMATNKPTKPEDVVGAMLKIPAEERTPQENQILQSAQAHVYSKAAAGANPLAGQMLGMDTPQSIAARGGQQVSPVPPASKPAAPAGLKQVGTSQGRPVYEDAQGNRFIQ